MAYITSHNSFKIVKRNNFKDIKFDGEVYKQKIYIFSRYEENCLLAIQELMKNPEKYFTDVYDPVVAKDSGKYIYKEQQPAYHEDPTCPRLSADFHNFELPSEIVERGAAEIERFRTWFLQNEDLLERPDVFVMRLQIAFNITYNPRAIRYENSGFAEIKNYSLVQLEEKIDQLLREAGRFYYADPKNTAILKAFGKRSGAAFFDDELTDNNTGLSDEDLKKFLIDYHKKFKIPIRKLLIEYYRIKLNPELKFAENLLEALGFRKCNACQENKSSLNNGSSATSLDDLPF